ncbi:hypothetical protein NJB14197_26460 [Mycobacterium montefiorense]|uniref:Uncharacterized protein n=1 Tax=Mycobacterium montefiorense TaxID=154654 RepID=A0AA37PQ38_9MYCO|nr:hypothetical protein MmonteBS_21870 [Mycobacterium montefiorense]GKU34953.1 hypothetical protein NJB14191_22990 [Mycobacterium montefiorense]GKU40966.1 hypothetical protein NJB14192_29520 [Mycobacterium montefiorense]GKU47075.1 hypothetical protein NJB14194_36930 [Mycobacterium montefiorense]GKU49195.1 hypothetical protein NJB14195_04420 [Mycobacterium montefiorense]
MRPSGPVRKPLAPNSRLGAVTCSSSHPCATSIGCAPEFEGAYREGCVEMALEMDMLAEVLPSAGWAGRYQLLLVQTIATNVFRLDLDSEVR